MVHGAVMNEYYLQFALWFLSSHFSFRRKIKEENRRKINVGLMNKFWFTLMQLYGMENEKSKKRIIKEVVG